MGEPIKAFRSDFKSEEHSRGAFFTPPQITDFLARWAIRSSDATVLDPTCGEGAFLLSAGARLRSLGTHDPDIRNQLFGVDLHEPSLDKSISALESEGLRAQLHAANIFEVPTPDQLGCPLPAIDAVIGNPPFVRYQQHFGQTRQLSRSAALRQGVRLNGLASSWASVLIHASGFLAPEGRLAMVLPAELLTVNYAEPVRKWLRRRFSGVTLVLFEQLQFEGAQEKVVLLLAHGSGGCESFNLTYIDAEDELSLLSFGDGVSVTPSSDGKWTDLTLTLAQRRLYRRISECKFTTLRDYGTTALGSVTGANDFFTLSELTRLENSISEGDLLPICPPGSKHLKGIAFTKGQWNSLLKDGERVWLLQPRQGRLSAQLKRYIARGEDDGVHKAYKCQIRDPWWRPPAVQAPDLFFTYMSHRYPRLVSNSAKVSFLNSMHGIRLKNEAPTVSKTALPLLALNTVTMLGAELHGRGYGGGLLKMEPGEAALLPMPNHESLIEAWKILRPEKDHLVRQLADGRWTNVAKRVDEILLTGLGGVSESEVNLLRDASTSLRTRRMASKESRA